MTNEQVQDSQQDGLDAKIQAFPLKTKRTRRPSPSTKEERLVAVDAKIASTRSIIAQRMELIERAEEIVENRKDMLKKSEDFLTDLLVKREKILEGNFREKRTVNPQKEAIANQVLELVSASGKSAEELLDLLKQAL